MARCAPVRLRSRGLRAPLLLRFCSTGRRDTTQHARAMLMPTWQPIVMLPTGRQTRAATHPTGPPHVLAHRRMCEARSFHGVLENQWLARCHRAMGKQISPGFREALLLAWTLLYSPSALQAGLGEEAHPEPLRTLMAPVRSHQTSRMERHLSHLQRTRRNTRCYALSARPSGAPWRSCASPRP
jgi:hypothetical protein